MGSQIPLKTDSMLRIISTAILFLVFITGLNAQYFDNRKYWSEEELDYDDFRANPIEFSPFVSEIQYFTSYEYKTREVNGMNYRSFEVSTYVDRSLSWIREEGETPLTLLYCQTIFNIAELYARKMERQLNQLEINAGQENLYVHEVFATYNDRCNRAINQFKGETNYGTIDSLVVKNYEASKQELKNNPRIIFPNYEEKNRSWGMDIGLGYGILQGEITDYLHNYIDFLNYGAMYNHGRFYYDLRLYLGAHKAKQEYNHEKYSLDADTGNLVSFIELSGGYQLLNYRKISVYPFIGFGMLQMSRTNHYDNTSIEGPVKFQPNVGLHLDYRLKSTAISPSQRSDMVLKARITYEPVNYLDHLEGGTLNLFLGIGMTFEAIRFVD